MPKTNPWFWMYGTWKLICELLVLENNEEINNIITMPQFIWHFFNRKCWTDQCFWQYKVWCPVFYCFVWVYFRVPKWYKCKYMKHYFKKNSDHFIFLFNVWICWYLWYISDPQKDWTLPVFSRLYVCSCYKWSMHTWWWKRIRYDIKGETLDVWFTYFEFNYS